MQLSFTISISFVFNFRVDSNLPTLSIVCFNWVYTSAINKFVLRFSSVAAEKVFLLSSRQSSILLVRLVLVRYIWSKSIVLTLYISLLVVCEVPSKYSTCDLDCFALTAISYLILSISSIIASNCMVMGAGILCSLAFISAKLALSCDGATFGGDRGRSSFVALSSPIKLPPTLNEPFLLPTYEIDSCFFGDNNNPLLTLSMHVS